MHICSLCKTEKQDEDFYCYGGKISARCRICTSLKQIEYQKSHPEIRRRRRKIYRKTKKYQDREKLKSIPLKLKIIQWKRGAIRRSISWELDDVFLESLPKICFYSGEPLTFVSCKHNTISLERIDSSKPYTKDNVVFCCADINIMKMDLSKDHFINTCKKIAQHHS